MFFITADFLFPAGYPTPTGLGGNVPATTQHTLRYHTDCRQKLGKNSVLCIIDTISYITYNKYNRQQLAGGTQPFRNCKLPEHRSKGARFRRSTCYWTSRPMTVSSARGTCPLPLALEGHLLMNL